jgi:hypothetical protein
VELELVLELQLRVPIQPTKKACKALCGVACKALYVHPRAVLGSAMHYITQPAN